jgi:hypothetical protein
MNLTVECEAIITCYVHECDSFISQLTACQPVPPNDKKSQQTNPVIENGNVAAEAWLLTHVAKRGP